MKVGGYKHLLMNLDNPQEVTTALIEISWHKHVLPLSKPRKTPLGFAANRKLHKGHKPRNKGKSFPRKEPFCQKGENKEWIISYSKANAEKIKK